MIRDLIWRSRETLLSKGWQDGIGKVMAKGKRARLGFPEGTDIGHRVKVRARSSDFLHMFLINGNQMVPAYKENDREERPRKERLTNEKDGEEADEEKA